jgi:hypothetical protein
MNTPNHERACLCFEIKPLGTWYCQISLNFCTFVILLQVDFAFSDELETIYKRFYKLKTLWYLHSFQLSVLDIIIG